MNAVIFTGLQNETRIESPEQDWKKGQDDMSLRKMVDLHVIVETIGGLCIIAHSKASIAYKLSIFVSNSGACQPKGGTDSIDLFKLCQLLGNLVGLLQVLQLALDELDNLGRVTIFLKLFLGFFAMLFLLAQQIYFTSTVL